MAALVVLRNKIARCLAVPSVVAKIEMILTMRVVLWPCPLLWIISDTRIALRAGPLAKMSSINCTWLSMNFQQRFHLSHHLGLIVFTIVASRSCWRSARGAGNLWCWWHYVRYPVDEFRYFVQAVFFVCRATIVCILIKSRLDHMARTNLSGMFGPAKTRKWRRNLVSFLSLHCALEVEAFSSPVSRTWSI